MGVKVIHHPLVQNNEYDHEATHEDVSSLSQKYLYPKILLEANGEKWPQHLQFRLQWSTISTINRIFSFSTII